jgi:hypothetical protein
MSVGDFVSALYAIGSLCFLVGTIAAWAGQHGWL